MILMCFLNCGRVRWLLVGIIQFFQPRGCITLKTTFSDTLPAIASDFHISSIIIFDGSLAQCAIQ